MAQCLLDGDYWKIKTTRHRRASSSKRNFFTFSVDHKLPSQSPRKKSKIPKFLTFEQKCQIREKLALKRSLAILKKNQEDERNRAKIDRKEKGTVLFEKILLGSKKVAKNYKLLEEQGVVAVLNITENIKNFHENCSHLIYRRIPIPDSVEAPIENFFVEGIEFIEHHLEKGKVLIHCNEGMSRSPAMAIAFIMKHFNINLKEAYEKVAGKLEGNNINDGFKTKLMDWDFQLFYENSFDFKSRKRNSLKSLNSSSSKSCEETSKIPQNSEPLSLTTENKNETDQREKPNVLVDMEHVIL